LPFRPHDQFKKSEIEERSALYRSIAEQLWNPKSILASVEAARDEA
jgi:hypothetical protein